MHNVLNFNCGNAHHAEHPQNITLTPINGEAQLPKHSEEYFQR